MLDKSFNPSEVEPTLYAGWENSGAFACDPASRAAPFTIMIPPPNVTGSLHMGHALTFTVQDVLVRWRRMQGRDVLWQPGTDHAGIATQMVVERELAKQGINRRDLGREDFEKRVWQWKEQYGGNIKKQMIRLGASCDWSRERFTLDPGLSRAVREVFVRLYEKGLIYRGEYMVNWCPRCQTAISDLEVAHSDVAGNLWHIRYPVNGLPGRFVTVATTRPETMLGDTAVAVNAKDTRYLDLHGKTVQLPLMDHEIPIILDDLADPEFGTGVVKVTPAHDLNDFEAGRRHNLPKIKVIDENARMTDAAGPYAGLDRFEARKRVIADLETIGALEKIDPYNLSLGTCQRCKTPVEPLVSTQWFVKMKPLAEKAIDVVENGSIEFIPANWTKTYYEWMYNIRDWCISRQLWWGHRIPTWHCQECHETIVARETPTVCPRCGSENLVQDSDVLDTWFSSGLWPFSTLGWPEKTVDLATYYPTSLLITGFDILFFWVARMIMMGLEFMGDVPFRQVYIHALVRDPEGQKMSKTKGNVIDPLVVTEKYGTDAIRMAMLQCAAPGTDIILTEARMESSRAFANKIWNAARFLFINMERSGVEPWVPERLSEFFPAAESDGVPIEDRWIFSRLNDCAQQVNRAIETYRYHEAAQVLWQFIWHEFCDWYVELKKLRFQEKSGLTAGWRNILAAFENVLRLLHPAMPFLTEELWQRFLPEAERASRPASIALANYPQYRAEATDHPAEREIGIVQEIVTMARNLRTESKLDPKQQLSGTVYSRTAALEVAQRHADAIQKLANVKLEFKAEAAPKTAVMRSTAEIDLVLEVPKSQEDAKAKRDAKELDQFHKNIANLERQLEDENFLAKAPEHIIAKMRASLAAYKAQRDKLL